jgi:hypothetical protein
VHCGRGVDDFETHLKKGRKEKKNVEMRERIGGKMRKYVENLEKRERKDSKNREKGRGCWSKLS